MCDVRFCMVNRMFNPLIARFAAVAALLALVLAAPAAFAQQNINYPENGTEPVASFSATDQDGDAISWSLDGADKGDFTLVGGVLAFKTSPNYESPADADTDNVYEVTVKAAGASEEVTVTVTNVDETGTVGMSVPQPQAGKPVTATLSDPDGPTTRTKWLWSRSADQMDWEDIEAARSSSYSPGAGDAGMYLRATATYYDPLGDAAETAEGVTEFRVEATPAINASPKFPDQDPGTPGTQNTVATLEVKEESAVGTSIGDPVAATDADNDPLIYGLDKTVPDQRDGDEDRFAIDKDSGQITVAKKLDADTEGDETTDADDLGVTTLPDGLTPAVTSDNNMYVLKVTATDPSDSSATIYVIVTLTEVDEAPAFTGTDGSATNPPSITVTEDDDISSTPTGVNVYDADDPEGGTVAYTLEGDDAAKFEIDDGALSFNDEDEPNTDDEEFRPDFEAPADKNKDNVYEVTVVATATVGTTASKVLGMKAVKVTVENGQDAGSVTLSQRQSYAGAPLAASLSDKDGGTSGTTWQWYRVDAADTALPTSDCDDGTPANCVLDGATSSSYTPVAADKDSRLRAVASYFDSVTTSGTKQTAVETTETDVADRPAANAAPKFGDQDPDTAGIQNTEASRRVDENVANENVGDPISAGDDQSHLIYTLSGADAGSFKLDSRDDGQIKTSVKLDYETKSMYVVTLTATDPLGASASITVNISVMDKQDPAVITRDGELTYAENGTEPVASFSATDQDGDAISWTLEGADKGDFTLVGGVLAFKTSPNYESPADADTDNVYEVTVKAAGASEEVTVTVTNVDETGTVRMSPYPSRRPGSR